MTLGEVIKKYRTDHDMSMDDFASKSGISKAYISILEKNRHPKTGKEIAPSIDSIRKAADGMGIDFNSLFNTLDGDVSLSPVDDLIASYPNIHLVATRRLPMLGSVPCGEPVFMSEEYEFQVDTTDEIKADFALKCKGDSMIGARIYDGDIVFVRKQETVENGEIAVVAIEDEATLKRFYKYNDLIVLRAENPAYKDMVFSPSDHKQIRILGKAVWFQGGLV